MWIFALVLALAPMAAFAQSDEERQLQIIERQLQIYREEGAVFSEDAAQVGNLYSPGTPRVRRAVVHFYLTIDNISPFNVFFELDSENFGRALSVFLADKPFDNPAVRWFSLQAQSLANQYVEGRKMTVKFIHQILKSKLVSPENRAAVVVSLLFGSDLLVRTDIRHRHLKEILRNLSLEAKIKPGRALQSASEILEAIHTSPPDFFSAYEEAFMTVIWDRLEAKADLDALPGAQHLLRMKEPGFRLYARLLVETLDAGKISRGMKLLSDLGPGRPGDRPAQAYLTLETLLWSSEKRKTMRGARDQKGKVLDPAIQTELTKQFLNFSLVDQRKAVQLCFSGPFLPADPFARLAALIAILQTSNLSARSKLRELAAFQELKNLGPWEFQILLLTERARIGDRAALEKLMVGARSGMAEAGVSYGTYGYLADVATFPNQHWPRWRPESFGGPDFMWKSGWQDMPMVQDYFDPSEPTRYQPEALLALDRIITEALDAHFERGEGSVTEAIKAAFSLAESQLKEAVEKAFPDNILSLKPFILEAVKKAVLRHFRGVEAGLIRSQFVRRLHALIGLIRISNDIPAKEWAEVGRLIGETALQLQQEAGQEPLKNLFGEIAKGGPWTIMKYARTGRIPTIAYTPQPSPPENKPDRFNLQPVVFNAEIPRSPINREVVTIAQSVGEAPQTATEQPPEPKTPIQKRLAEKPAELAKEVVDALEALATRRLEAGLKSQSEFSNRPQIEIVRDARKVPRDELVPCLKIKDPTWTTTDLIVVSRSSYFSILLNQRNITKGYKAERAKLIIDFSRNPRRFIVQETPEERARRIYASMTDDQRALRLAFETDRVATKRLERGLPPEKAAVVPPPELAEKMGLPLDQIMRFIRNPLTVVALRSWNHNRRDFFGHKLTIEGDPASLKPDLSNRPDLSTPLGRATFLLLLKQIAEAKAPGHRSKRVIPVSLAELGNVLDLVHMAEKDLNGLGKKLSEATYVSGIRDLNISLLLEQQPLILIEELAPSLQDPLTLDKVLEAARTVLYEKKRAYEVKDFERSDVKAEEVTALESWPRGEVSKVFGVPDFSPKLEAYELVCALYDFAGGTYRIQWATAEEIEKFLVNGLLEKHLHRSSEELARILKSPEFPGEVERVESQQSIPKLAERIRRIAEEAVRTYERRVVVTKSLPPAKSQLDDNPFQNTMVVAIHRLTSELKKELAVPGKLSENEATFLGFFHLSSEKRTEIENRFLSRISNVVDPGMRRRILLEALYSGAPKDVIARGEAELARNEALQRKVVGILKDELKAALASQKLSWKTAGNFSRGQIEFIAAMLVVNAYEIQRKTGKNFPSALRDSLDQIKTVEWWASIGTFLGTSIGLQAGVRGWATSGWKKLLEIPDNLSSPSKIRLSMRVGEKVSKVLGRAAFYPAIVLQRAVDHYFQGQAFEQSLAQTQVKTNFAYYMLEEELSKTIRAGDSTIPENKKRGLAGLLLQTGVADQIQSVPAGFTQTFERKVRLQSLGNGDAAREALSSVSMTDALASTVILTASSAAGHLIPIPGVSSLLAIYFMARLEDAYRQVRQIGRCRDLSDDWKQKFESHVSRVSPTWSRFASLEDIRWRNLESQEVQRTIALETRFWQEAELAVSDCANVVFPAALTTMVEGAKRELALADYLQLMSPSDRQEYIRQTSRNAASADMLPDVRNQAIWNTYQELTRISKLDPREIAKETWSILMKARGQGNLVLDRDAPTTLNRELAGHRDQVLFTTDQVRRLVPQLASWLEDPRGAPKVLEQAVDRGAFAKVEPSAQLAGQWLVQDWEQPVERMATYRALMGKTLDAFLEDGNREAFVQKMLSAGREYRDAWLYGGTGEEPIDLNRAFENSPR